MSEDNNTNVTNAAEEVATATVDSSETTIEEATQKVINRFAKDDRVGRALKEAKSGPPPKTPETMSIEQLSTVDLGDGGHKGLDYNAVVQSLPEDAQKLMANLRADYTRKTQELSNQRKELEAMRQSLVSSDFNEKIDTVANAETVELDPYDDNSFNARIEQEVARRLQEMMRPIRMEQELSQKRMALENFKRDNPDLMDMKEDVAEVLKSNDALSLQDAYYIVKGRKTQTRLQELEQENKLRQEKMREAGLKISSGTNGSDRPPKGLKGYEVYKWLQARKTK